MADGERNERLDEYLKEAKLIDEIYAKHSVDYNAHMAGEVEDCPRCKEIRLAQDDNIDD